MRSNQWSPGSPPPAPPWQSNLGPRVRLRPRGEGAEAEEATISFCRKIKDKKDGAKGLAKAGSAVSLQVRIGAFLLFKKTSKC